MIAHIRVRCRVSVRVAISICSSKVNKRWWEAEPVEANVLPPCRCVSDRWCPSKSTGVGLQGWRMTLSKSDHKTRHTEGGRYGQVDSGSTVSTNVPYPHLEASRWCYVTRLEGSHYSSVINKSSPNRRM